MADNSVFITGIADGAFNNLPGWVIESTAGSIEGLLEKTLKAQTQILSQLKQAGASSGSGGAAGNFSDDLDNASKSLVDETKKRKLNAKDEGSEWDRKKKRWGETKANFPKSMMALNAIAAAGNAVSKILLSNLNAYGQLNTSGVNTGVALDDLNAGMTGASDGFQSLRQITILANVRYTELLKTLEKYSTVVNQLGAGRFAKVIGMASADLTEFGFTSKESGELLGAMLETQLSYSDLSNKSAEATRLQVVALGKSVFRLSMTTGVARSTILSNMEAIAKSTESNVLAGRIGNESAEAMDAFLGSFKDQNLARSLLKLMSDPIKPLNETFMALQKSGMGGFAQAYSTFADSLIDMPADMKEQALKSFVETHRGQLEAEKQRLALLSQAGVEGAKASLDLVVSLTKQADSIKRMTAEDEANLKSQQKSNAARTRLANAWEGILSKLQSAFSPSVSTLEWLAGQLEEIGHGIGWVVEKFHSLSDTTQNIITFGLAASGAIAGMTAFTKTISFMGALLSPGSAAASAPGMLSKIASGIGSASSAIWNILRTALTSSVGLIGRAGLMIGSAISSVWGVLSSGLGVVVRGILWLANPVTKLAAAFAAGYAIGTVLSEILMKFEFVTTIFDKIFAGLDRIVSMIPGSIGSDARERIKGREKYQEMIAKQPESTKISVTKTPAPSTINSPSAVAIANKPAATSVQQGQEGSAIQASIPARQQISNNSDTLLAAQNSLLEQILLGINSTNSTNKDILRYTKVQT